MTKEEIISGTLAWCNERRAEKGKEPLSELPMGRIGDPLSCPCGKACGLWVGEISFCDRGSVMNKYKPLLPEPVRKFVALFDKREFPDLIEKGPHWL